MRRILDQRGVTLVEILAATVIASIISIIIYSTLINSKEQYKSQAEKNAELTDISYALKVITKDIRKSGTTPIINNNTTTIGANKYVFDASSKRITRNDNNFIEDIILFEIKFISSNKYEIVIKSERTSVGTEIIIRSEK